MDIKGTEDKVNQIDSLLTTITRVLKKHWLILLLILLSVGVYYIGTDDEVYDETYTEEVVTDEVSDELGTNYYDSTEYGYEADEETEQ